MIRPPPRSTLLPYPPLFRSHDLPAGGHASFRRLGAGSAVGVEHVLEPHPATVEVEVHEPRRAVAVLQDHQLGRAFHAVARMVHLLAEQDRKSTRLNSHLVISYAVFCLK